MKIMNEKPNIIAIVPAYNEEKRITPVILNVKKHLDVLVVDDGSKDNTADLAQTAGAQVLRQNPNAGKGAALRAGFTQALQDGCTAVITLDADGQHDPREIPLFLECYQRTGADLIIGARDFRQMPLIRKIANWSGTQIFSLAMGRKIRDNQSGYRLISCRMMAALLDSSEQGFEFEVEMIMKCLKNHWELDWVPIRTIYSDQGSHIRPGKHFVNFIRVVFKTWREMRRE